LLLCSGHGSARSVRVTVCLRHRTVSREQGFGPDPKKISTAFSERAASGPQRFPEESIPRRTRGQSASVDRCRSARKKYQCVALVHLVPHGSFIFASQGKWRHGQDVGCSWNPSVAGGGFW